MEPTATNDALRLRNDDLEREVVELRRKLSDGQAAIDALSAAQKALQASELKYRTIVTTAQEGIFTADAQGRGTFANERIAAIMGYTLEEMVGRGSEAFLDPSAHEEGRQGFERRRQGIRDQRDMPIRRKDGTLVWMSVTSSPLVDAEGNFAGSLGMVTDITERKRTEAELRESRSLLEQAQAIAQIGSWASDTDADGRLWLSEETKRIFGLATETFDGRLDSLLALLHPEDRESVRAAVLAARNEGGSLAVEFRIVRPDDGARVLLARGRLIRDASGGTPKMVGVVQDVTEQRMLEDRLRQSQKMEAVGRLAGGVAHDFNNILTVILGYGEVLLAGLEPGPMREAMTEVQRAGERAAALTRQLLAFSRKQTLVPEVLDVGDVVRALSEMVTRLIGEDIEVSVAVDENLGRVRADRGQLEQVIVNLAVNARDAMPDGGRLLIEVRNVDFDPVYTRSHSDAQAGAHVLIAVSDTGVGMDAETRRRIFEPFFTTKGSGKGTGLGLATVHGIVLQSGGSISVYSEPGHGATFKVYLPVTIADSALARTPSDAHPAVASGAETILLVEDESAIRELTNVLLREAGYSVLVAEGPDVAEGISGSHRGPIHLLLTDVVMPGMKGPELARRLVRHRPGLRVLYMSGYTDDAVLQNGILEERTAFLQKPFTPRRLVEKVRAVLGDGR